MSTTYQNLELEISYHAQQRLRERFPGYEGIFIQHCRAFYAQINSFTDASHFRYVHGNMVAVIKGNLLITVYPRKPTAHLEALAI